MRNEITRGEEIKKSLRHLLDSAETLLLRTLKLLIHTNFYLFLFSEKRIPHDIFQSF